MNTSNAINTNTKDRLRIVKSDSTINHYSPQVFTEFQVDSFVHYNYNKMLRSYPTSRLLSDLKALVGLRKLGMTEYRHLIAEFSKEEEQSIAEIETRFWFQLTLLKGMLSEDKCTLQDRDEGENFEMNIWGQTFEIEVRYPNHPDKSKQTKYPVMIFNVK